jgi:spermidine/putrescine transport system substrate-binding protein
VIPKEGTDLFVDTMVVTAASENKDAAMKFIDFVLQADNGAWVPANILYKVPNKAAMEALDPALIAQFPNLGMAPAELLAQQQLRDLGAGQKAFSRTVTEILASN